MLPKVKDRIGGKRNRHHRKLNDYSADINGCNCTELNKYFLRKPLTTKRGGGGNRKVPLKKKPLEPHNTVPFTIVSRLQGSWDCAAPIRGFFSKLFAWQFT